MSLLAEFPRLLAHSSDKPFSVATAAATFVLRFGEVVLAALPDLLVGVLIAVLLRHFLGDARLKAVLGRWWAAAIVCVALPVGPAGILPVAIMLRRAGVSSSAIAAVLIGGGAVGPLSLAYLMERATPGVAGLLIAMLLVAVGLIFLVVAKIGGRDPVESVGNDTPGLVPALAESRSLLAGSALPLLAGLLIFACIAAVLAPSYFGEVMHETATDHLFAAFGVLPIMFYLPAATSLFAGEAAAGVYPGAAWTALFGGGLSIATVVVAFRVLGKRSAFSAIATTALLLVAGFVLLQIMPRLVTLAAEDSHAFDGLSQPFHLSDDDEPLASGLTRKWLSGVTPATLVSAAVLLVLCLIPRSSTSGSGHRAHLSAARLRVLGGLGVVVWIVGTLYVYFPSPALVLDQMRHPEGVLSARVDRADRPPMLDALKKIDRLARRGQVGARLRFDGGRAEELADIRRIAGELSQRLTDQRPTTFADMNELFRAISLQRNQ